MVAKRRGGKRGGGSRKPNNQWSEEDMHNEKINAYYKAQNILSDEEFEQHLEAFRRPLPTTFRITGTRESATRMRDYMQRTFIPYLSGKMFEGKPLKPPEAIDWYPDELAYQLDIPKQAIRKNPDFQAFQKFLVMETDAGNVVRQEVVSMIPPLLMNIKPDSTCLDMCAAPGSKTSQMVEYLHEGVVQPAGLVLANDSDFKRAHMLVHQVKRLNSPSFMVTNHDATFISNFHTDANRGVQKFDRILADVPCSGDGTLRKNFDVWKNWNVSSALILHPTQVNCLRRGLQMLAVGGRLVYSTCSLNPIENEAVLNAVLSQLHGAAHLVDVSDQLPSLKRRPGLHTWKAVDKLGKFITSMDDVDGDKHRFPTSIFPPSPEQAQALHLERALRVYPHLGNTGGFFVAVIDKVKEISGDFESVRSKPEKRNRSGKSETGAKRHKSNDVNGSVVEDSHTADNEDPQGDNMKQEESNHTTPDEGDEDVTRLEENAEVAEKEESIGLDVEPASTTPANVVDTDTTSTGLTELKPQFKKSLNDEYFKFLAPDHPEVIEIAKFYGLPDTFDLSCLLSRNISGDPVRSLYYTSPLVKRILESNEGRIKFVHAGVKLFHKQNIENLQDGTPESEGMCKWRVAQDGIDLIKDFVSPDKFIDCTFDEMTIFMQHEFPRASLFSSDEKSVASQLKDKKYGCYLLRCDLTKDSQSRIPEVIVVPLWKSKVTIQMMIARQDKMAIYTRVTGKELPLAIRVDSELAKQMKEAKEETETMADVSKEDEDEAIDTTIADAAAAEEEGSAANVL